MEEQKIIPSNQQNADETKEKRKEDTKEILEENPKEENKKTKKNSAKAENEKKELKLKENSKTNEKYEIVDNNTVNIEEKVQDLHIKKYDGPRKYTLKNDVFFKSFFARKGNEKFLIDFLSGLLNIEITQIKVQGEVSLEQLNQFQKPGRLDILATLNDDTLVDIEMQMVNRGNVFLRDRKYLSGNVTRESRTGVDYEKEKRMYSVWILNYDLFPQYEEYMQKTVTVLKDHKDCEIENRMQSIFIQLPIFRKKVPDMYNKVDMWLLLIDGEDEERIKMAEKKDKIFKEAEAEIEYLTGDAAKRKIAQMQEDWQYDVDTSNYIARKQGLEEGEKNKSIAIAKKMKDAKTDIDFISQMTGLTKEEIEKL